MNWCKISPPLSIPDSISIEVPASKSIFNRLLIIQRLATHDFSIEKGPLALDSIQLQQALLSYDAGSKVIESGEGGTSFRFLLAYLATVGFEGELVASGSMVDRPIKPLIRALNILGANVKQVPNTNKLSVYLTKGNMEGGEIQLDTSISSQFVSALLLVGPYLSKGLVIQTSELVVSESYISMTVELMKRFGIEVQYSNHLISVPSGAYLWSEEQPFTVESDWSAASYFWMHSHSLGLKEVHGLGLHKKSLQGDAILHRWASRQGSESFFTRSGWTHRLTNQATAFFGSEFEGLLIPDLAMSHISLYAFLGHPITYTGLSTLAFKESDRLKALQKEWAKAGIEICFTEQGELVVRPSITSTGNDIKQLIIDSHGDHRIAMCLSVLASTRTIWIKNPEVVSKSFPNYWIELSKLGYEIQTNISPES